MLYNIKYTVSKQYVEQEPNRRGWNKIVSFSIAELDYQDFVSIPIKEFTKVKAKKLIKEKIKIYLAKLADQEEYQEEI